MKGLYTLTLPFLWLLQISLLIFMVIAHIFAAPIRALVYWGHLVQSNPGWRGFLLTNLDEDALGISIELKK